MAAPRKSSEQRKPRGRKLRRTMPMVFTRKNYSLLILGIAVIVVGYVLMRWENEVDGVISLYIAPLLILGGYIEVMYAIFYREKTAIAEDQS